MVVVERKKGGKPRASKKVQTGNKYFELTTSLYSQLLGVGPDISDPQNQSSCQALERFFYL
jgi:hypothetical protein